MKFSPRAAITLTFIAFGMMSGAQFGAIPALKEQAGVSLAMFGLLAGLSSGAGVAGLGLGGVVNRYFDHRTVLLFILPMCFASLVACLASPSVWVFGVTLMVFTFSYGMLDVFMNAEATTVEHDLGKPIFASFHAAVLYAIGIAGLLGSFIAVKFAPIWAALPAIPFVLVALWAVHQAIPHRSHEVDEARPTSPLPYKLLTLIGIIIGFDVAAELACVSWAGQLLAEKQPALAAYSGLGMMFYGLCNGSMRVIGDNLRKRYSDMSLITASFVVGLLGFVILAFNPGFGVSVVAFAVAGIGLGMIFPCLFSVAANLAPESRAAALGHASAVSGPPRIFMPMLLGWLAQIYGLSAVYAIAALACVFALIFTFITARAIAHAKGAQVAPRPKIAN